VIATRVGQNTVAEDDVGASRSAAPAGRLSLADRAVEWLARSRSHRVLCLLFGLWTINAFDLVLTVLSNDFGLLHESNPIAARILPHGTEAIILYKCTLVAIGSYPLVRYRNYPVAELAAASLLIVYSMVAVQWKMCYDFYSITATIDPRVTEVVGAAAWAQPPLY